MDQNFPEAAPSSLPNRFGWLGDAARWGWAVFAALTVSLYIIAIPERFYQLLDTIDPRSLFRLGVSPDFFAGYMIGLSLVVILFHMLVASLLFLRRLDDPMALFVAYALVANGALIPLTLAYPNRAEDPFTWVFLAGILRFIALFTSFGILYLFPDGRFVPRPALYAALGWGLLCFGSAFLPGTLFDLASWPVWTQILILLVFGGSGVYLQSYRYQHLSTLLQRQQVKWAFLGLVAALLGPFAYFSIVYWSPQGVDPSVPNILYQRVGAGYFAASLILEMIGQTLTAVYLLFLPLSFGIAIFRYRLWDIDIIIRRTLIYSTLTAVVGWVYFTSIVVLQWLFRNWTESSQLVVVLSTLLSAMLFRPLFRRIQNGIDRRFYRSRYNAEKTLLAFSAILRNEVELDHLTECLLGVVQTTLQPDVCGVWIKPPPPRPPPPSGGRGRVKLWGEMVSEADHLTPDPERGNRGAPQIPRGENRGAPQTPRGEIVEHPRPHVGKIVERPRPRVGKIVQLSTALTGEAGQPQAPYY